MNVVSDENNKINHKVTIWILFFVVLIDQAGLLLITPVFPDLLTELTHLKPAQNVSWMAYLVAIYAIMQFIFAPVIGRLSDRYGRKPILAISMLAFFLDYIVMALAPNVYILFIGRVISGIAGASFSVAMASVADISDKKNRMSYFGVIYAAVGVGLILGPLVGGVGGKFGLRIPFWIAALFALINFLFVLFFYKETLLKKIKKADSQSVFFLTSFKRIAAYPNLKGLMLAQFLVLFAFNGLIVLWSYFTQARYHWNVDQIGYSLSIIGVGILLVQILVVPIANKKWGDKNSVLIGLILYTLSSIGIAVVYNNIYLFLIIFIVYCLASISSAAASSIVTGKIPEEQQGELQGVLASVVSISLAISPVVMSSIFRLSIENKFLLQEGNIFLVSAIIFLITFFIYAYTLRNSASVSKEHS